ncbi:MAG TPA: LEA type 2 family protein [Candidatus Deferrimicrobiaceae bacterium]
MRIPKLAYLPIVLLLAAFPLSGCRQLVKEVFKTPKVELREVALDQDPASRSKSPWRFVLTLDVDNPNPYPLDVARFAYTGMLGHDVVAEGDQAIGIHIEPSGVTTIKVPVALNPGAFDSAARQVLTRRSLSWEFNGSVGLQAPMIGVIPVPFSKTGTFDLAYILKRMGIGLN